MSEYEAARCVIGSKEHGSDVGYLCGRHLEQAGVMLREIEDQAVLLSAVPSMQQRNGSRGGSLASQRTPARLEVLVHNDPRHGTGRSEDEGDEIAAGETLSILNTLHSWARIVREERDFTPPARITVTGERDTLSRSLEWVAAQDWVDEFYADTRKLLGQLKVQNTTNEVRAKPVGICPTLFDEGECGGRLWPNNSRGDVVCDRCDRIFLPDELRHLGQMLIRQGYVEVFRAEWFTGVPAGTIRRWVSEARCTSQRDGKKLLVQIIEIEQLRDRKKRRAEVAS